MDPEIPILMITLQIPVTPDTDVKEVLDAIAERVAEALAEARRQQAQQEQPVAEDPEAISAAEFKASLVHETEERFSDTTRPDLLSRLGYTAAA
jgi:hypothetical protein